MKQIIHSPNAPKAIGTYSQAVKVGNLIFLSGQIPLDPKTMELVVGDIKAQIKQVFENLLAVTTAANASFNNVVKLTVYLTDLTNFPHVNEIMATYFAQPYPARVAIGVASLPKGAQVEIDAIIALED